MKIASIEVLRLAAPVPEGQAGDSSFFNTLVRMRTDDGLEGIGETEGVPSVVRAIIEGETIHPYARGLASVLLGREITDVAALWELMYEASSYHGRRGAVIGAISALDMALWDIMGKAEGVPASKLLGAVETDGIACYVSAYPLGDTDASVRKALDDVLAYRPRAIKLCAEPDWAGQAGRDAMTRALDVARSHCGPDVELMVDMYGAWRTAEEALAALPLLAERSVGWLEAPLPLDDLAGYAALHGHGVPIAAGDLGATTRFEFDALMDEGKVDIIQPDLTVAGGFTEIVRIGKSAAARNRRMLMHHYKSDILLASNLHIAAIGLAGAPMEFSISPSPIRNQLTLERQVPDGNGRLRVPEAPGIGVSLDEKLVAALQF